MRSFLTVAACLSMLFPAGHADARERRVLQPSGKWIVDYADQNCRLARPFGQDDALVTLLMDQFAPGDSFRITFAGKVMGQYNLKSPPRGKIQFAPNEKPTEVGGFAAVIGETPAFIGGGSMRLTPYSETELKSLREAIDKGEWYELPPIGADREKAVKAIEITGLLRNIDLVLETGRMDKAFEALRTCSWDTVKSWGLNVDQQKSRQRGPTPLQRLATLIRSDDYPPKLLRQGQEGFVNVRLIISDSGLVESCAVQRATKSKEFEDLVCAKLSERARFKPAIDASGKNIRSFYTQAVVFSIQ